MARITVEDCLEQVPNRFTLVLIAAERAKQLLKGAPPLIEDTRSNKEVVTALREIAAGAVRPDLSKFDEDLLLKQAAEEQSAREALRASGGEEELPPEPDA